MKGIIVLQWLGWMIHSKVRLLGPPEIQFSWNKRNYPRERVWFFIFIFWNILRSSWFFWNVYIPGIFDFVFFVSPGLGRSPATWLQVWERLLLGVFSFFKYSAGNDIVCLSLAGKSVFGKHETFFLTDMFRAYWWVPVALQMLRNMKGQFAEHLLAAGFVNSRSPRDPKSNINSGECVGGEQRSGCDCRSPWSLTHFAFLLIHRQWEVAQSCDLCRFISKGCKDPSKLQQKKENVRFYNFFSSHLMIMVVIVFICHLSLSSVSPLALIQSSLPRHSLSDSSRIKLNYWKADHISEGLPCCASAITKWGFVLYCKTLQL